MLPFIFFYRKDLLAVAGLTIALQLPSLLKVPACEWNFGLPYWFYVMAHRTVGQMLGQTAFPFLIVGLYSITLLVFLYFSNKIKYLFMIVSTHIIFLMAALPRFEDGFLGCYWFGWGDHYFFIPSIMLLWGIALVYPKIEYAYNQKR